MGVALFRSPGRSCPLRRKSTSAKDCTNARISVKYRVYCVIFCWPVSPSLASSCRRGIATVISCITIDAVMYGMIPNENTAIWLNAPPVKTPKRLVIAFPLVSRPLPKTSRFIPGSGTQHPRRYRIKSTAVNMSFRRSSGTRHALPKALSISPLQCLDAPAGRLDLLPGRPRERVRPHLDGARDLPNPEDLDQRLFLPQQPCGLHLLDADGVALQLREFTNVDGGVDLRT